MLRHIKFIKYFFTLMFILILSRLGYLQLFDGPYSGHGLAKKAAQRWEINLSTEEYARGDILDRYGESLSDSYISSRIIIFPWLLEQSAVSVNLLKKNLNEIATEQNIDSYMLAEFWLEIDKYSKISNKEHQPVILYQIDNTYLMRQIEFAEIPGIAVLPVKARFGTDSLAKHFIGYMNRADQIGVAGLEKKYNELLKGSTAEYIMPSIQDVSGNPLPNILSSKPKKSLDPQRNHVITTIDKALQEYTEKSMDQYMNKGAVVVLEIKNGDIIAIASRPNFDQNRISNYLEKGDALINRATRPEYYPGSVFKVVTAAAGLESSFFDENEKYNCNGSYDFNDNVSINCLNKHGEVDLEQAFAVSCNGYFIKLSQEIGSEALGNMSRRLGLACELKQGANLILTGNTAIGQQGVKVSPLQMARIYAMIARGGLDIEPQQVISVIDQKGLEKVEYPVAKAVRVIDELIANKIKKCLKYAAEYGTAKTGWIENIGTAAKTGTAQANDNGRVIAWYCGFTPIEKSKYAIVVMVEEDITGNNQGLQGGKEAASIFKAIGNYLLK